MKGLNGHHARSLEALAERERAFEQAQRQRSAEEKKRRIDLFCKAWLKNVLAENFQGTLLDRHRDPFRRHS